MSRESLLIPAVAQQIVNTLTRRMQGSSGWAPYNETEHLIPAVAGCLSHNGKQERDAKGAKSDIKPGHLVPVMALSERTRANGSTFEVERDPVMPALKTGTQRQQAVAVPVAQVQWASGGGKVHNLTAQALRSGAEHNYQFAQVGMQVRRLTPTECARLQGFPDDWLDGLGFSDSTKYKCLGNAVCVNVTEWIARRLACADTGG